jgi:hypothetical protein
MKLTVFALFLFFLAIAPTPAFSQDPYKTAPENYRLEFENEYTRISRATLRPGDKIPVHDHPPHSTVYVYLTDGGPARFSHDTPKFSIERQAVKAGGIRINQGMKETHQVEYLGSAPSEYLRIEMKNDPVLPRRTTRLAPDDDGPFDNPRVRIRRSRCPVPEQCIAEFPSVVVSIDSRAGYWVPAGRPLAKEAPVTPLVLIEFRP